MSLFLQGSVAGKWGVGVCRRGALSHYAVLLLPGTGPFSPNFYNLINHDGEAVIFLVGLLSWVSAQNFLGSSSAVALFCKQTARSEEWVRDEAKTHQCLVRHVALGWVGSPAAQGST